MSNPHFGHKISILPSSPRQRHIRSDDGSSDFTGSVLPLSLVLSDFPPQPPSERSTINIYEVGQVFCPLIRCLRLMGICPLACQRNGEYYEHGGARIVIPTMAMMTVVTFFILVWTLNRAFSIYWPIRLFAPLLKDDSDHPDFFTWVTMALQIILPISSLISGHLSNFRIRNFAKFLNNWSEFLRELDLSVSPYYKVNLNLLTYRRIYFYLFFLPATAMTIISSTYLTTTNMLEVGDESSFINKVFIIFWAESMVVMRLITNLKDFMNLTVLSVAYRELRKGIQAQYDELQDQITLADVRAWFKLLHLIRQQRTVLENYFGLSNLWLLIEMFVIILLVLTAAIFVFMRGLRDNMTLVTTYVVISVFLISFLFCKAHLTETITEQEDILGESIIGMNDGENCEARLEMKAICDLIFHDPVKITIANVTVLNKRLILAFCSQLAASLVILLQFVNH